MTETPRHRRRPDARPDEILDAAQSVFLEQGFSGARVDAIAKRADLSKGAIYLYFPSKDAMLKALIERSVGQLARDAQTLVAAGAPSDPAGTYRLLVRTLMTAISDPAINAAPRLVLTEALRFPELAQYYRQSVINIGREALRGLLAAGQASGKFRAVEFEAAMRTMVGPGLAHLLLSSIFVDPDDPDLDPAELAENVCDIVLNGLSLPAEVSS